MNNKFFIKLYVPYKIALKLKELKFDDPCSAFYYDDGNKLQGNTQVTNSVLKVKHLDTAVAAPTWFDAHEWLEKMEVKSILSIKEYKDNILNAINSL